MSAAGAPADAGRSGGARERARAMEARWQALWRESGVFRQRRPERPKWYVLELPPFATGSLHLGHARNYVMADAAARFRRMAGFDVLYTTGYDTFGLPSELAAREAGVHPAELVEACCAQMGRQLQALGLSHDDRRIAAYHEPAFYRWVQWVFLRLLEAGHCTRRQAMVLWCPHCDASLTEGLAEAGRCWRCHSPVEQRLHQQWFVREADFAEAMLEGLDRLDGWPESTRGIHRDWIGRRVGWRVEVAVEGEARPLTVFIERPGDLAAAVAIALPADHPLVADGHARRALWPGAAPIPLAGVDERLLASPALGAALVPGRNPAHDRLLSELGLATAAPAGGGEPAATPAVAYRLKDWCVTRQRYWGPPVPVIHCGACGPQPVPERDLPVLLPADVDLAAPGNPLVSHAAFKACVCPRCGLAATRDTDTFEAYSSPWWYHWLPMEPGEADLFDAARAARWLPVDLMIGGADQVRSCFFHVRMIAKALKALGFSDVDEPVAELLPIGMVQTAGVKMSKSAGNMVGLDDLLAAHGCDAVRFAVLSAAAPERDFNWTDTLIQRAERFLAAVGRLAGNPSLGAPPPSGAGQGAAVDPGGWRTRLAGWIATGAHKITQNLSRHEFHLAGRNLEFLLDRLQQFERATRGAAAPDDARALREAWEVFVRLLAPTAPHLAEALWAQLGHPPFVAAADGPVAASRPPPRGVERAPEAVA